MTKFYYVNAVCGSGKTTSIVDFYQSNIQSTNWRCVIAQPKINLINQTSEDFKSKGFRPVVIHSENGSPIPARGQFTEFLNDPSKSLAVISHQTLVNHPNSIKVNKENAYLIIDEFPKIIDFDEIKLDGNKHFITNSLIAVESNHPEYYILKINNANTSFYDILNGSNDEFNTRLQDLFSAVENNDREAYVSKSVWDNFLSSTKTYKLVVHLVIKPEIFRHWPVVVFAGANFFDSMLYKFWSTVEGVEFSEWNKIKNLPTIHSEMTGKRLTINYHLEYNWSKNLDIHHKIIDSMIIESAAYFDGKPYIYAVNNSVKGDVPLQIGGVKVSVEAHGQNQFKDYNYAIFLAALNNTPAQCKFLTDYCGVDSIADAFSNEIAYQFVLRTSLRNPKATEPVELIVSDKRTALFIQSKFPGSVVRQIGTSNDKIKDAKILAAAGKLRALTDAEKSAKAAKRLKEKEAIKASLVPSLGTISYSRWDNLKADVSIKANHCQTMAEFEADMHQRSRMWFPSKFDGALINGSGHRVITDSIQTNLILIDIDNTTIHPQKITATFKFANIVHNSFSNREGNLRYRMMVPLSHKVDRELHDFIVGQIISQIGEGIDHTSPIRVYLEPSMPETSSESDYFFYSNNFNESSVLDAMEMAEMMVAHKIETEFDEIRRIDKIIDVLRDTPIKTQEDIDHRVDVSMRRWASHVAGTGNKKFYQFGLSMAGMGIPMDVVELMMRKHHTSFGSKPKDRLTQIPSAIKNITKQIKG